MEVLQHPLYSSLLLQCDYQIFGTVKQLIEENQFNSDGELEKFLSGEVSVNSRKYFESIESINWERMALMLMGILLELFQ